MEYLVTPLGGVKILIDDIEKISYSDRGPESGEMLECQAFYNESKWKLSISVECETGFLPEVRRWSERYDYDARYLENGMSYVILAETKEEHFVFGIAWIDNVEDDHARDVQTWFAADTTVD